MSVLFSNLLKELRLKKGISQTKLAKEIGVSPGNVGDWESGRSKPGYSALVELARFFDVSADYLLELDNQPVKTSDPLSDYKKEHGLSCDGSPLDDDEADLVAMYRLLPEHQQEDVFDLVYFKYRKHVERKKESIYWTYTEDRVAKQKSGPARNDDNRGGTA